MTLRHLFLLGLTWLLTVPVVAQPRKSAWERSLVTLEITQKTYDYLQPWTVQSRNVRKDGVVLDQKQIITTAEGINDQTLIRLQKGGRGLWTIGELAWIDYHANLALVTVAEPGFWEDLRPVTLPGSLESAKLDSLQVVRWRNYKLEFRNAEFNDYTVDTSPISFVPHVYMVVTGEIEELGYGEAVIDGERVVGLAASQAGNRGRIIPAPFIKSILSARAKSEYRGLGYFDFVWQPSENPAIQASLKLEGPPRGVVVIDVPSKLGQPVVLKKFDLILKVDGFNIDSHGDYDDPEYGHLQLENLSNRGRWAGDELVLTIWRDGAEQEVRYKLPLADYRQQLVPSQVFDQEPEYLVVGGLLFQPLTETFLRRWGETWERRAPFRLGYYDRQEPSTERPALVMLSMVLPDPVNLGYQDYRYMVIQSVNGHKINYLNELQAALEDPQKGFHVFEFEPGSTVSRIVLNASQTKSATERVLQRYGIDRDHLFAKETEMRSTKNAR